MSYIVDKILRLTADQKARDDIFAKLKQLGSELEGVKQQVNLADQELAKLAAQYAKESENKLIKSMFPQDDAAEAKLQPTFIDRFRLDALQLQQRAITCDDIKADFFKRIQERTKGLSFEEERMADVKGMPRAFVKLQEYSDKKEQKGLPVSSSVYECKDLLRLSYVCRNSAETAAVLKALTSDDNTYFTLYMFKNGFKK